MRYLTGSKAFFGIFDDYNSKDIDYVEIVNDGDFRISKRLFDEKEKADIFVYKKVDKDTMLNYFLEHKSPMSVCMFLTPDIYKEFGISIEDLQKLKPLMYRKDLDEKHHYIKMIFDFYLENNSFTLTDEQRLAAYNDYKKSRGIES